MKKSEQRHKAEIIDQFSRQAIPFTKLPGHKDGMGMMLQLSGVSGNDTVLDVACGPGMVSCEFARVAGHVTGVDITEKMISAAKKLQKEKNLGNMDWMVSDAIPLKFADGAFSLVVSRYSFHHFMQPEKNLAEMVRVCANGGRVMVADVAVPADKSEAYDKMERMRDPSHVHALTCGEFTEMFSRSGLEGCRQAAYDVEMELEAQIRASFPKPGDDAKLRKMITDDVGTDRIGINARNENGRIMFTYPISVFIGFKRQKMNPGKEC